MILMIIVGIVVLITKRIKITRHFVISGSQAKSYGIALIAVAIPATILLNVVARLWIPRWVLASPIYRPLMNATFLAAVMLGLAFYFRDKISEQVASESESQ